MLKPRILTPLVIFAAALVVTFWSWQIAITLKQPPQAIEEHHRGSNQSQANGSPWFVVFRILLPGGLDRLSDYCNAHSEEEKRKWLQVYYCDFKVTDIYLAVFTGLLWFFTTALAFATIWQAWLTRNEFVSSHRPEIRLKLIWLASQDGRQFDPRIIAGQPIVVRLDMVNVGHTSAHVQCINFVALILPMGQRLPQRPPYNDETIHQFFKTYFPKFKLLSGMTLTHAVADRLNIPSDEDAAGLRDGTRRLYCMGVIEYVDDSKRWRQTAFCRYLHFEWPARSGDHGRFKKANEDDYEFQD